MSAPPNHGPQPVRTKAQNRKIMFEGALQKAIEASPDMARPYFLSVAPMLVTIFVVFDFFIPYISYANNLAWKYGEKAYIALLPYEPEFLFPMVAGMFLMLFGGHFMMIVTCVEAYRICGWDTTKAGLLQLYADYKNLKEANAKDDELDEDNDGIKDVLEISDKELVTRKFLLFLRSCDPQKLAFALAGIYSGFIAVMASVRIKFARTIALGVAIGDCTSSVLMKTFRPFLERVIPTEYHKWIPVLITYISKLFGIYIAATVERILTAFHSGIRGATLFVAAFTVYTKRRGRSELSEGYWDEAFAFLLAAFGIWAQVSSGFRLPFPLNLLLLPVTIVEKILTLFVYYAPSDMHA